MLNSNKWAVSTEEEVKKLRTVQILHRNERLKMQKTLKE